MDNVKKNPDTNNEAQRKGRRTFRQTARVVRMLCAVCMAIRRYAMDAGFLENYTVNVSRKAVGLDEEAQFSLKDFQLRKELPVPKGLIWLLDKHPDHRTPKDIQAIARLMLNLPSFRKYTREMQHMFCKIVRFMKCHKRRVVLRQGHIGYNLYFIYTGSVSVVLDKDDGNVFVKPEMVILKRGACFGEIALTQNTRRNATVVCHEDCEFLVIDKDDFLSYGLNNQMEQEIAARYKVFRSWPAFSSWKDENIRALSYVSRTECITHGKVIVKDSRQNEWLWFIVKGSCDVLHVVDLEKSASFRNTPPSARTSRRFLVSLNAEESTAHKSLQINTRPHTADISSSASSHSRLSSLTRPKTTLGINHQVVQPSIQSRTPSPRHCEPPRLKSPVTNPDSSVIFEEEEDDVKEPNMIHMPKKRSPSTNSDIDVGVYVRLDTLRDGQCFGLESIFGKPRAMSLVSGGCEVIHVPRNKVVEMADEATLNAMKLQIRSYPNDDELSRRFLERNSWDHYKTSLMADTLARCKRKTEPLSHNGLELGTRVIPEREYKMTLSNIKTTMRPFYTGAKLENDVDQSCLSAKASSLLARSTTNNSQLVTQGSVWPSQRRSPSRLSATDIMNGAMPTGAVTSHSGVGTSPSRFLTSSRALSRLTPTRSTHNLILPQHLGVAQCNSEVGSLTRPGTSVEGVTRVIRTTLVSSQGRQLTTTNVISSPAKRGALTDLQPFSRVQLLKLTPGANNCEQRALVNSAR